jgi:hypothetical protein
VTGRLPFTTFLIHHFCPSGVACALETPWCSHVVLISGMCRYGRDNSTVCHTALGYNALCIDNDLFKLQSTSYIGWLCCSLFPHNSPTAQSSSQINNCLFWSKLRTPAPICGGCRLPLSRPHSHPSGSHSGTNSIEKGHVSGALLSPTDLTQRLHVAILISRITKKSQ